MNPFTQAHSFESPGFYMYNIDMSHKLLWSAAQSHPHEHAVYKKQYLLLFVELGFIINILSMT
jgi:hypothetical protein